MPNWASSRAQLQTAPIFRGNWIVLKYEPAEADIFRTALAYHSGQASPKTSGNLPGPDRQQKVDVLLGADQYTVETPLSESERSALWDLAGAPVSPPYKEAQAHEMTAFKAGRQYFRLREYSNPANQTVFERAIQGTQSYDASNSPRDARYDNKTIYRILRNPLLSPQGNREVTAPSTKAYGVEREQH
jgi:hypothetical protein